MWLHRLPGSEACSMEIQGRSEVQLCPVTLGFVKLSNVLQEGEVFVEQQATGEIKAGPATQDMLCCLASMAILL